MDDTRLARSVGGDIMIRRLIAWVVLVAVCLSLPLSVAGSAANENLSFLGESYAVAYRKTDAAQHALIELVRPGEDLKSWKKLLGLHRFRQSQQTPKQAAIAVAAELRKKDPAARFEISEHAETGQVLIDFLAFDGPTVEFNAFKYRRAAKGTGLVAVQYAERFALGAVDAQNVRDLRRRALAALAGFDLGAVEGWFDR
jgi:hypothetical protein